MESCSSLRSGHDTAGTLCTRLEGNPSDKYNFVPLDDQS
jgi:hypothetical protein